MGRGDRLPGPCGREAVLVRAQLPPWGGMAETGDAQGNPDRAHLSTGPTLRWRKAMFRVIDGIPVWGDPDPSAVEQIKRCVAEEHAAGGALMADHHKGYSQPIGGVVAYRDAISPSGVGYDIGCGNKAVRTPLRG